MPDGWQENLLASSVFARIVKPLYVRARAALDNALFDRRYGLNTEGELSLADRGISADGRSGYQPARLLALRRILPLRDVVDRDVFIDFGSGKGRVVLLAALHYPFRTVYGVELSEPLHEIAQENVERARHRLYCSDVRLVRSDVLKFDIPDDVTVAFFNNPFGGQIFATVVERLLLSVDNNPRTLRIVYGNPLEEAALFRTGRVHRIRQLRGWHPGREWSRSNSYRLYEVT